MTERENGDETMFPTPEEDAALAEEIANRPVRDTVEVHGVMREIPSEEGIVNGSWPSEQELEDRDMADALNMVARRWPLTEHMLEWLTDFKKGNI